MALNTQLLPHALALCVKYGASPRQVHDYHLTELQELVADVHSA